MPRELRGDVTIDDINPAFVLPMGRRELAIDITFTEQRINKTYRARACFVQGASPERDSLRLVLPALPTESRAKDEEIDELERRPDTLEPMADWRGCIFEFKRELSMV